MANEKIICEKQDLVAIADAVRDKTGTTASMTLGEIADGISEISTGLDTSDATATASDILSGKTAYAKGSKVTGTIATKTSSNLTASGATVTVPAGYYASNATKSVSTATQATPSVSVSSSGLITASATQTAGYVSAGTKSGTKQLTTQSAKTVTPTTSNQTAVASGRYTTGAVTVKGDANLVASNIKSGVSIFGVNGTYAGGENLDAVLAEQAALITELETALEGKASGGGGGVETCTVVINHPNLSNTNLNRYDIIVYENNNISYISKVDNEANDTTRLPTPVIIDNVVCGSLFAIGFECASMVHGRTLDGADEILSVRENDTKIYILRSAVTQGGTITVTLYDAD